MHTSLAGMQVRDGNFRALRSAGYDVRRLGRRPPDIEFRSSADLPLPTAWQPPYAVKSIRPEILIAEDCYVFPRGAGVIVGDFYVYRDILFLSEGRRSRRFPHGAYHAKAINRNEVIISSHHDIEHVDGTYFVATNFRPANFYHFVHEVIARRYYLEMAEQALGMRLPVLMWNPRYPMQSLLLDHIYGDRDWHLHPAGKVLHFSRAVIARHPATPSGLCLPAFEHLRTKLRNLARGFAPRWGSRRPVYISRQDGRSASFNRKLANENELMERLAKIGFEVVLASKLDPQEQLSLYSTAPVMAGIHGAGLSNMLFMPDGGAVLEFSGVPLADPLFARDALVLGFDFCLAQSQMTDAGPMADLQTADRFLDHLTDRGLLRSQGRGGRFRSARRLLGVAGKKKAAFATHKKPPDAKQSRSSGPPPSCS